MKLWSSVDGQVLEAALHDEWRDGSHLDLVGSLVDLKSAYKQLTRRVGHRFLSIIAVWDPEQSAVKLFEQLTLAFGQTAAVNGFCRTARCLKDAAIGSLCLPLTNFFDDFSLIEPRKLQGRESFVNLLELLGWK